LIVIFGKAQCLPFEDDSKLTTNAKSLAISLSFRLCLVRGVDLKEFEWIVCRW